MFGTMRFLALRSDQQLPKKLRKHYVYKADVQCDRCRAITYQLHTPVLETEEDEVEAQKAWLTGFLYDTCPAHPEHFLTPDRQQSISQSPLEEPEVEPPKDLTSNRERHQLGLGIC